MFRLSKTLSNHFLTKVLCYLSSHRFQYQNQISRHYKNIVSVTTYKQSKIVESYNFLAYLKLLTKQNVTKSIQLKSVFGILTENTKSKRIYTPQYIIFCLSINTVLKYKGRSYFFQQRYLPTYLVEQFHVQSKHR